jgi:hypothetical protein
VVDEPGPLDPRLHANQPALAVEPEHRVHRTRVEHGSAGNELLAAHGVTAARKRHGASLPPRLGDRLA